MLARIYHPERYNRKPNQLGELYLLETKQLNTTLPGVFTTISG
jgi:hypothetical protein